MRIILSRFNPARKAGVSYLWLKRGSARVLVRRSEELFSYDFKVQTELTFTVTKEADFIVKVNEKTAEITALENSHLEVTRYDDPERTILLPGIQRLMIDSTSRFPKAESVPQTEVEGLLSEFRLSPDGRFFASSPDKYRQDNDAE
jgi:hypothetical protein